MDFAERWFFLNSAERGETKRQSLQRQIDRAEIEGKAQRVAELEAELEAELSMPPFPKALGYLWRSYLRLRRRKGASDMGAPRPIEWPDIDAFLCRSGVRLTPWEIEILEGIDDLFVNPEEPASASTATRPMTETLFDTLFA
jgi:hypothetical protein